MSSASFDALRFSRGLREIGVPEQQADRLAELMADAFSTFADEPEFKWIEKRVGRPPRVPGANLKSKHVLLYKGHLRHG